MKDEIAPGWPDGAGTAVAGSSVGPGRGPESLADAALADLNYAVNCCFFTDRFGSKSISDGDPGSELFHALLIRRSDALGPACCWVSFCIICPGQVDDVDEGGPGGVRDVRGEAGVHVGAGS